MCNPKQSPLTSTYSQSFDLCSILLFLVACGDAEEADAVGDVADEVEKQTITIGYQKGNTLNILRASGLLKEILEEAGHDVDWIEFWGVNPLLEALLRGIGYLAMTA